jgi:recombination DNA repair RAD52 pathway protein
MSEEIKHETLIAERGELDMESVNERERDIEHYHASIMRAYELDAETHEDVKGLRDMEQMNEYVDRLVDASDRMGKGGGRVSLNKMVEMMIQYRGPFAWSNRILETNVESRSYSQREGTWTMRISVLMELYGGSIREPMKQYGVASYTGKDFYMVYSMCIKGATTDSLKRCLENVQMI